MEELVFMGENSQALTNSLLVAEKFGKRHADVIRSIDNLLSTSDLGLNAKMRLAFVSSTYMDSTGKDNPIYIMNRKGFSILVMGYNGVKALKFKDEFYDAFEYLETKLKEQQKPLSQLEILSQSVQVLMEHDTRLSSVEQRLDSMDREREENTKLLLCVSVSSENVPELSLRDKIRKCVNLYAESTGIDHRNVWHKVYEQIYYLYRISIRAYKKDKKETLLDVAERNQFLDKIYTVISNMIRDKQTA